MAPKGFVMLVTELSSLLKQGLPWFTFRGGGSPDRCSVMLPICVPPANPPITPSPSPCPRHWPGSLQEMKRFFLRDCKHGFFHGYLCFWALFYPAYQNPPVRTKFRGP